MGSAQAVRACFEDIASRQEVADPSESCALQSLELQVADMSSQFDGVLEDSNFYIDPAHDLHTLAPADYTHIHHTPQNHSSCPAGLSGSDSD